MNGEGEAFGSTVQAIYREESRRAFATLIRLLGDFDLAEEAVHDASAAAMEQWARDGVLVNPRAAGRGGAIQGC
jgi:RNA polymerase sigma-70 factor (ECF subfamily)